MSKTYRALSNGVMELQLLRRGISFSTGFVCSEEPSWIWAPVMTTALEISVFPLDASSEASLMAVVSPVTYGEVLVVPLLSPAAVISSQRYGQIRADIKNHFNCFFGSASKSSRERVDLGLVGLVEKTLRAKYVLRLFRILI